ncbi:ABC transporter substrate-binding protein [Mesorhizobium sp. CO1-1-8]|uniref:ABC transporter substrate-binding protein n=1 Tax=Mesorhizobium sp. CO1-1-8 TaxID=2876631 RepID=UPI001CD1734A|nr:ABC transporter substrate-binding protein [Mesorhizobium sp. CO1-1-8]MBZ9772532.1 ABC transporter substrate-binding protein [Mesorhizobium sp. CO1-1-8]
MPPNLSSCPPLSRHRAFSSWERQRASAFPGHPPNRGRRTNLSASSPSLRGAIAQHLGLKLQVQNLGFDSLIPSLEANRINIIMSGMLDTVARQKRVDFIDHIVGGSAMLQQAKADRNVSSLADICGLKASALRGAVEAKSAQTQSEKCVAESKPAVEVQVYPDTRSQLAALASGRTDVALGDLLYFGDLSQTQADQFKLAGEPFNSGPCAIAVPKGSSLGPAIVNALNDLIADGTYGKILSKYKMIQASYVSQAVLNGVTDTK